MDDKKLFALLEAVRSGSLSKAAAELGYTQSGLTQMMNSLEDELGCCLLVRSYNGIKLTPAGEQLLPLIEDAAGSLKRLKDEANQTSAGQNKPIRIGVFPSISKSWLPYVLKEYQRRCPGTSIEITVGNIEMQTWLEHDMVDIVLGEESMKAGYRWIPLREDYYFGVVPAEHPLSGRKRVSVEELSEYPFIMSQILELKQKLKPLIKNPIREEIQINAADDAALLSLVEEGLGVSILPEMSLKGHSELVTVLELDPPLKRTIGIVMPRSVRRQVSDFTTFVRDFSTIGQTVKK